MESEIDRKRGQYNLWWFQDLGSVLALARSSISLLVPSFVQGNGYTRAKNIRAAIKGDRKLVESGDPSPRRNLISRLDRGARARRAPPKHACTALGDRRYRRISCQVTQADVTSCLAKVRRVYIGPSAAPAPPPATERSGVHEKWLRAVCCRRLRPRNMTCARSHCCASLSLGN
ncbi:hypothetical protein EVAR_89835_1 [Eumeta japonica]|uniref:Uncharacterized protein n=1 Tax=Eumeta variegata TaxID=151549 RepID=A0A4C2ADF0_EUMVA|nr:hypothetical protein EVAR_89835_1 [Eumeta japonica]